MAMADTATFEEPKGNPALKWALIALAVLALVALVWFVYTSLNGVHGVQVKEETPVISPMLPPPPPPPPPPPKPQEKPPEPTEKPTPAPQPSPTPDKPAPAPMQMNAEAQAGATGGIASGTGGGMGTPGGTGTCLKPPCGAPGGGGLTDALYTRYLSTELQQRIQRENRVNRDLFTADVAIWIAGGRITRVEILRGTGSDRRDAVLKEIMLGAVGLNAPPSSFKFPQKITVRGRKAI